MPPRRKRKQTTTSGSKEAAPKANDSGVAGINAPEETQDSAAVANVETDVTSEPLPDTAQEPVAAEPPSKKAKAEEAQEVREEIPVAEAIVVEEAEPEGDTKLSPDENSAIAAAAAVAAAAQFAAAATDEDHDAVDQDIAEFAAVGSDEPPPLDAKIDFNESPQKASSRWNQKYEELKAYAAQYGNCLVPSRFADNQGLATWVLAQREQYKSMKEVRWCLFST